MHETSAFQMLFHNLSTFYNQGIVEDVIASSV